MIAPFKYVPQKDAHCRLPTFLVVGAAKCGTTSLTKYLGQHPDVFISRRKEPNFFVHQDEETLRDGPAPYDVLHELLHAHTVRNMTEYQSMFAAAESEAAVGEGSVRYLYFPNAAKRIHETLPGTKIIAMLRHPVARMFSHHAMMKQFYLEPLNFIDALRAENERRDAGWGWDWHYAEVGKYAEQVRRYLELFGPEQVKVLLYDDYKENPRLVFQDICRFIGVDDQFAPDMKGRQKVAYRPIVPALDRWLQWPSWSRSVLQSVLPRRGMRPIWIRLAQMNRRAAPKFELRLSPVLRSELIRRFDDDILALEELIGQKTKWLADESRGVST